MVQGALDGIYIDVTVPKSDKSRYPMRKSRISTNVFGVCNRNMNFVYVLSDVLFGRPRELSETKMVIKNWRLSSSPKEDD
ncbi:hypothetical protein AHAS_Ahas17G0291900 [Arachis hypogaea]